MKMADKILKILNESEDARKFNKLWNEQTEKNGLTEKEKKEVEEMKMYILLLNNKEAMDVMAEQLHKDFNMEGKDDIQI